MAKYRKIVEYHSKVLDIDYCSLSKVIAELNRIAKKIEEEYGVSTDDIIFEISIENEYGDEFVETVIKWKTSRLETDDERNKRLADARKAKEIQKQKELAEYERLSKKYGNIQ